MTKIKLKGRASDASGDDRVDFLTTLIKNVAPKENHIDNLRQRNIAIALVAFAALFGFGLKASGTPDVLFVSMALTILMVAFTVLDRRYHMFSHGWRRTSSILMERLADAINTPDEGVTFLRYCVEGEKNAEWFSVQAVIYYCLIFGGALSFLVFR